ATAEPGGHRPAVAALPLHRRHHRVDAGRNARDHDQDLVLSATQPVTQPNFPPVTEIAVTSMALIVADAIYMASYLPEHVPLGPSIALLAVSAALMATNFILLIRVPGFNWRIF